MNDATTPSPAMEELVERGVKLFYRVETGKLDGGLEQAHADVLKLVPLITHASEAGMMGKLRASRMKAEAMAAAGAIGEALRLLYTLHRECTDIAIEHGVDRVPDGKGGVVVLGGGGR